MSDFCGWAANNVAVPPGSLKATEGSEITLFPLTLQWSQLPQTVSHSFFLD